MRLLGNKTRLLPAIEELLAEKGFSGGTLIDIFSGTASVGRHFKSRGFRVIANDHLSSSYTQAVATVEVSRYPAFAPFRRAHRTTIASREFRESVPDSPELNFDSTMVERANGRRSRDPARPLREAVRLLDRFTPPREGLIFRNYCPGGPAGRRYFQDDHGRKIDGILELLRESHRTGLLARGELHLLLASLIDAADKVANISGTYGAYLKSWQPNTRRELRLEVPAVHLSPLRHEAHQGDANELVRRLDGDVLYLDPPYNHRQYAANYHLLEIIAEHHRVGDLAGYEASLYGKTGLRPYDDLTSLYCVRHDGRSRQSRAGNVLTAMTDLILSSRARAVVVSYNEEGLLRPEEIGGILALFSRARSFDWEGGFREIDFPRFRSDADRAPAAGRAGRSYRRVEGREPDRVRELLFFAERAPLVRRIVRAAGMN